jgi:hypothetical protein
MLIKTKKSGFEDVFFIIVVLFALIIFLLIMYKAWGEIKSPLDEGLTNSMPSDTPVNISITLNKVSSTSNTFDRLIPFLLIGLIGMVMIGAGAIIKHPIMLFAGLIILGVAILLAGVYSNVYHQLSQSDEFADTTAGFGISDIFMQYLPVWILLTIVGAIIVIIYTKTSGGTSNL